MLFYSVRFTNRCISACSTHNLRLSPFYCIKYTSTTMPPKKATTSKSKRKAESDDDATRDAKRPKAAPESSSVQPTNKVLPTEINFPKKLAGTVRIASWNVAGLAAAQKKVCRICYCTFLTSEYIFVSQGFKHYVEAEDPDILILTETKVRSLWLCT